MSSYSQPEKERPMGNATPVLSGLVLQPTDHSVRLRQMCHLQESASIPGLGRVIVAQCGRMGSLRTR